MPVDAIPKARIKWFEPYRHTVRSSMEELRSSNLPSARSLIRLAVIAFILIAPFVGWMLYTFPVAIIPWSYMLLGGIVWPIFLTCFVGMQVVLMPLHVDVRRDWIQFTHGQHAVRIKAADIQSVEVLEGDSPRFRIIYRTKRGFRRTKECVIARSVDREALKVLIATLMHESQRHVSSARDSGS